MTSKGNKSKERDLSFRYEPVDAQRSGSRPIIELNPYETDNIYVEPEVAKTLLQNVREYLAKSLNTKI